MSDEILVRMYDGQVVRAKKGMRKAVVIRRYYMNKYAPLIAELEDEHGIPAGLFMRLIDKESAFNPKARSKAGALGLAQLMPVHNKKVNPLDPEASLRYGANYLASHFRKFNDWDKALASYNWGRQNVIKASAELGDAWLTKAPEETRKYVRALGPYANPRIYSGPFNPRRNDTSNNSKPQNTNYGSSLGAEPPSLEPTPDTPLKASFLDKLEQFSIGAGRGLESQAEGLLALATDPIGTGKQLWETAKQIYDDPYLLAEMAREIGRKAGSGSMGLGEVVGEFISPNGIRNAFRIEPKVLEVDAYHVSPYDFDKFKLDKTTAKSGLGAQAWGYGVYTAGELGDQLITYAEAIARKIKFTFTKSDGDDVSVVSDMRIGQELPIARSLAQDPEVQDLLDKVRKSLPPERVRNLSDEDLLDDTLNSLYTFVSIEENLKRFKGIRDSHRLLLEQVDNPESRGTYNFTDARADILSGLVTNSKLRFEKAVPIFYKVDIPDEDVARMLRMDVLIKDQPEVISKIEDAASKGDPISKAVLENLRALEGMTKRYGKDFNGFHLYEVAIPDAFKMVAQKSSAQARSEYLLGLGVPGIIVDSTDPGRNFVVFDPSTMKITEKVPLNEIVDMEKFIRNWNKR